jgi:uncharacterized membrane protein
LNRKVKIIMTMQGAEQEDRPYSTQVRGRQESNGWPQNGSSGASNERLAKALGWFSIGLGLAQVAAPGEVARFIGVGDDDNNRSVMRAVGMREIASGVGILTQPRPAGWLWARVGGDVMDLTLLGAALSSDNVQQDRVMKAAAAVVGVTLLDLFCGQQLSQQPGAITARTPWQRALQVWNKDIQVHKAITVNKPLEEVYRFWRNFQNLPRFMSHLESVQVTGERQSHWKVKAPAGTTVEWDAEIIDDRPNEQISWRSLEGADVDNSGTVRFQPAPKGRGTEVHVELHYSPPGGVIGATIAKLFGEAPEQQLWDDLRAFKQVMEVGEIVQSDASIHQWPHPARPPEAQISQQLLQQPYAAIEK